MGPLRIPVVMLHSVVGFRADRPETFPVWCPPAMFEGYLRWLTRRGFTTITLFELHAHLADGAALPRKPIVLTFDDGYLDNWVYAVPLLKKYGHRGTVFVPSDFVQPGETVRPTIEDVEAGRMAEDRLEAFGYMNRAELRACAASGVLDVQSHGRTHTWLPVSEEVIDFVRPGLPLRHLRPWWWNAHPERKPYWFQEISPEGLTWGAPVYRNKLALTMPAITPDPGLADHLAAHVAERGGRVFFDHGGWRDDLTAEVEAYRRQRPATALPESLEAFEARLRQELAGSREALEAITGRPVRFMCWPNGGTCPEAFALLHSTGYLAATLPSKAQRTVNARGCDPTRIGRISGSSFFRGTPRAWPWVMSFALKVERSRGNRLAEIPIKAIWLWRRVVRPSGATPAGAEL